MKKDSKYPDNFKGVEGEELNTYIFGVTGEVEVENYNEESAMEEFMNMTMREALQRGLYLD